MPHPPAGRPSGSLMFMWVSLCVMALAFLLLGQQRRPARSTSEPLLETQPASSETVTPAAPEPSQPVDPGIPRNM